MKNILLNPLAFADIPLSFPFPTTPPAPDRTTIVALGKAAFTMTDRFLQEHPAYRASPLLLIAPECLGTVPATLPPHAAIVYSTHPHLTEKSFSAGAALVSFVSSHAATHGAVIVLLSGGASALVEYASDQARLVTEHRNLLYGGLPIEEINRRRIAFSDIKGGKLTRYAPHATWFTFVMSDIPSPTGSYLVGSMPSWTPDNPRHHLIPVADCSTIHAFCSERIRRGGYHIIAERLFHIGTVAAWCTEIAALIPTLGPREALLFCGEPTLAVTVPNPGVGGRMAHLALMLLEHLDPHTSLFALSSDGIDGNSPYAGVIIPPEDYRRMDHDHAIVSDHLARFDSYSFFEKFGCTLRTGYTGINLNDVVAVVREEQVTRTQAYPA